MASDFRVFIVGLVGALTACAFMPDVSHTKYKIGDLAKGSTPVQLVDKRASLEIGPAQRRMLLPESMFEPAMTQVLSVFLFGVLPDRLRVRPIELLEASTEARLIGGVGPSRGVLAYDLGASPGANAATNAAGQALATAILSRDRLIFDTTIRLRIGDEEFSAEGVAVSQGWDRETKARESVQNALTILQSRLQRS